MSKRILITGGFGYLGGRIATHLAKGNLYTLILSSRKEQSAPGWLPAAETICLDYLHSESMVSAMEGVNAVIHLAAMNENECVTDPARAVVVNTLGTRNVLEASIDGRVDQFIYFSTAHVYGAPLMGHITEETLPKPVHPYAITHHGAEDFVLAANRYKKIKGTVIRLSNGFGVPTHPEVDRWTLLVNDLCRQLAQTGKMQLLSSGVQKRDFITLEDIGRAVAHLLELPQDASQDGLFNLGGQSSFSVWEIAQRIAVRCKRVLGFAPEIIRPTSGEDEIADPLFFDSNKFRNTGFIWEGDMDKEIDETLQMSARYFQKL